MKVTTRIMLTRCAARTIRHRCLHITMAKRGTQSRFTQLSISSKTFVQSGSWSLKIRAEQATTRNLNILERHLSGESTKAIAKHYKLSRSRIWQICAGLKRALKKKAQEHVND